MLPCPSPGVKSSFVFPPTISLPGMELSQSAGVRGQQAAEASVHETIRAGKIMFTTLLLSCLAFSCIIHINLLVTLCP